MTYKYISSIPKPLMDDFLKNRVVPIVGAGFSKNADIQNDIHMPDWRELGALAAKEIAGYEYDGNAIDALSYYEELFTRPKLVELLMRELHHGEIQPGDTVQAFCNCFSGTICTTNFDTLLEDAMVQAHHPASVIVTEDRLTVAGNNESKIIKIHGDYNHPDKMVITEHDFDTYLEKNPVMATYLANLFISNTMLLVGYSLDDNDLRGIWQVLHNRLGKMSRPAYCITVGVSEEKKSRYQRRNIMIIDLNGDPKDYKNILRDFFVELKNYYTESIPSESKNEKVNEQLLIPAENNRLCFFSCATSRTARLSSIIYPILNRYGVTPVRLDDMIMPGDNWVLSLESLIQKSRAAIIDVSDGNPNIMFELNSIISNPKLKDESIIICEEKASIPVDVRDYLNTRDYDIFYYSFEDDSSDEVNNRFIRQVEGWCVRTYNLSSARDSKEDVSIFEDAKRLYRKAEYSACILAAYSSIEEYARKQSLYDDTMFSYYLRNKVFPLIQTDKRLRRSLSKKDANQFIVMRNQIAHGQYKASEEDAKKYLKHANTIVNVIQTM